MTEIEHEEPGVAIVERPKGEGRLEAGVADGNKVLAPADWQMLSAIAETVNNTEFVPAGLRGNSAKVLACMLYGHALGISPMISLKEIAVIDGTPSMSSALMVAKVLEAGHTIERVEIRDEADEMTGTTAIGTRSDGRTDSYTFTIAMARRAGLMGKKNWQNYPEAMLWWRASSQLCSFLFPDVFMGSPYMPEELGADTPIDAALEAGHGGAVIPPAVPEPPAGDGQGEPPEAPEAPNGAAEATETAQDVAARLVAKLEGRSEPEEAIDHEAYDAAREEQIREVGEMEVARHAGIEGGWTPLDERDPTAAEYETAQAVIASGDQVTEDELADAQMLVEAYEEANAVEPEPTSVVVKGTVAELLLEVAGAQARGDVEWLEAVLAQEQSASRPRIRLVAGLEAAIRVAKGEPPLEEEPETAPFTPAAEDEQPELEPETPTDEQRATLAEPDMQVKHTHDPTVPLDELDHVQLVVRARAAIGYLVDAYPDAKEWKYEAVVAAASNLWKLPMHSLDDLENWQLQEIIKVMPADAMQVLEALTGEQVEKLAASVTGNNPS